jgi:DNA polymerase III sliding clamp (beta) subunit (PCNA family)
LLRRYYSTSRDTTPSCARLSDPGSPTIIQDREGSPALYVLMPLRV